MQVKQQGQEGHWVIFNSPPSVSVRGCRIPQFAIMWSEPWPDRKIASKQFKAAMPRWYKYKRTTTERKEEFRKHLRETDYFIDPVFGGKEPNWYGAMRVDFLGESVRVFPHECHTIDYESMTHYCHDDMTTATHILRPDNVPAERMDFLIKEGNLKVVFEQALIDGASHAQALSIAYGFDGSAEELLHLAMFPRLGWWCPRPIAMRAYGFYDCPALENLEKILAIS